MSSITTSPALAERIGVALVIGGAIALATQYLTVQAYVFLTVGSAILVGVAIGKNDPPQAVLQLGFVFINAAGLLIALGARHA